MVWVGMSIKSIIRNRSLAVERYRDDILRPIAVPYAAAFGDEFVLTYNNARSHRARLEDNFLFDERIFRMYCPAYFTKMNHTKVCLRFSREKGY